MSLKKLIVKTVVKHKVKRMRKDLKNTCKAMRKNVPKKAKSFTMLNNIFG